MVGNLMIDTLMANREKAQEKGTYEEYGLDKNKYALLTMHRPSNVDHKETLEGFVTAFKEISSWIPIIYPVHPRSKKNFEKYDLWEDISSCDNIILTEPVGYHDILNLQMNCTFLMTDSGGMQEESSVLGKPCITLRFNTERPVTVDKGSSVLVGTNTKELLEYVEQIKNGTYKHGGNVPMWDGQAAGRIVDILMPEALK